MLIVEDSNVYWKECVNKNKRQRIHSNDYLYNKSKRDDNRIIMYRMYVEGYEMDEFRVEKENRLYYVYWPVGSSKKGVTCITRFYDEIEAKKFVRYRIIDYLKCQ